jgi:hypothetical protein
VLIILISACLISMQGGLLRITAAMKRGLLTAPNCRFTQLLGPEKALTDNTIQLMAEL